MAATTTDRNTRARKIDRQQRCELKSGSVIPAGAIVATDATGRAVNGADTAGLIVQGRAEHSASYADGDREIVVGKGIFLYANDGTITIADVGGVCTVLDNQTVSKAATTTNDIAAGHIEEVTSEGVWVDMMGGKIAAT